MRPVLGEPIRHGYTGVEKRLGMARRFASWQGARVLDLGCGNGAYTLEMAREAAFVCGVDVEPARLREFAQRAGRMPSVTMLQGVGEALPFPDRNFDVVFCIETLEHVTDERRTLAEIRRVLRPGGRLLLTIPNKWYPFETHGLRPAWLKGSNRYPLVSWLPKPIHSRLANARIYTEGDIRALLGEGGFRDVRLDWMLPPLDKVGVRPLRQGLRRALHAAEGTPLRRFGVSLIVAARKPDDGVLAA